MMRKADSSVVDGWMLVQQLGGQRSRGGNPTTSRYTLRECAATLREPLRNEVYAFGHDGPRQESRHF